MSSRRMSRRLTLTAGDADAAGLNLEAEAALIFPKRSSNSRLGSNRGGLTRRIKASSVSLRHGTLAAGERQDVRGHAVGNRRGGTGRGQSIAVSIRIRIGLLVVRVGRRQHWRLVLLIVTQARATRGRLASRHVLCVVHVVVVHRVVADNVGRQFSN